MEQYNIPEANSLNSMEGVNDVDVEKLTTPISPEEENNESENNSELIIKTFIGDIVEDMENILHLCSVRDDMQLNKLISEEAVKKLKLSRIDMIQMNEADKIDGDEFSEALARFSEAVDEFGRADKERMVREDLDVLRAFHQKFQSLSGHIEETGTGLTKTNQDKESGKVIEQLGKLKDILEEKKTYIERRHRAGSKYLGR